MKKLLFLNYLRLIFVLPLFFGLINPSSGTPPQPLKEAGLVIWIKGTLQAQQPNQAPRALKRHSSVYEHDTIIAGPGCEGRITLKNNIVISLKENSTAQVDQFLKLSPKVETHWFDEILPSIRSGLRTITSEFSNNLPGGYNPEMPPAE